MIKSIELKDWKTHKSTVFEFGKGVNVLVGLMGAGKSSVMDALSFALFGTFPALKHKRVTLDGIINNRPTQSDDAEVTLNFTVGESSYRVFRRISQKESAFARIEKDGSYLQTQPERVNEEIESLLKIDYDTFSRAVYSEQNRLDYFLEITKSDRKREIDRMLGLDLFATAEENTTALVNSIRALIKDEEQTLAKMDINSFRKQLESILAEREKLAVEQLGLEQGAAKKSEIYERKRAELAKMKEEFAKRQLISNRLIQIRSTVTTLKGEIKKIEDKGIDGAAVKRELGEYEAKQAGLSKDVERLKSEERSLTRELAGIDEEVKTLRAKIIEREKHSASIKGKDPKMLAEELDNSKRRAGQLAEESALLKSKESETGEFLKELEKHVGQCPVCERELGEDLKSMLKEKKGSTLDDIRKKLAANRPELEKTNCRIKELEREIAAVSLAASRLKEYEGVEDRLAKAIEGGSEKRPKLEAVSSALSKASKEYEASLKEYAAIKARQDELSRREKYIDEVRKFEIEAEKSEKEMQAVGVDQKAIDNLQDEANKEANALAEMKAKTTANRRYIESLDSQAGERKRQIESLASIEQRIAKRRALLSNLNLFKAALADTSTALRNRLVSSINGIMATLWPELYPYGDYTGIRMDARKDDYTLEVNTGLDGEASWQGVELIASGGERSIGCLTLRIALAMVIVPNLRWLILDEPTHNIDAAGIEKLIKVLQDSLPKVVEQIFIITHDDALRNISTARVYQLDRDKSVNEPTKVVEV